METKNFLWPLTNQHLITAVQLATLTVIQVIIPLTWGCVEVLVVFLISSGRTNHLKTKYLRFTNLRKGFI